MAAVCHTRIYGTVATTVIPRLTGRRGVVWAVVASLAFLGFLPSPAAGQKLVELTTRIPAPPLDNGGEWLNTPQPLELRDLRGKFVILDFWTYCCINCMHILPELKQLEKMFPENLVVVGVHSAKFYTERDARNVQEAIDRYEIDHPVLNDPLQVLWRRYEVDSWPSLRIIDPTGQLIATHKGEFSAETIAKFLRKEISSYRRRKLLNESPVIYQPRRATAAALPLSYPGKVVADANSGRLFIADSGHHRIVVTRLTGELLEVIGSGQIGREDGPYQRAQFDRPQGMAVRGDLLFVADTENHLLRRVDLRAKRVDTLAGTGEQLRASLVRVTSKPLQTKLASPWDLCFHEDVLYVAMAGSHQIWRYLPESESLIPYAGNVTEDIVDGPRLSRLPFQAGYASFAQPSGLATDGDFLFVADSEGSSIRAVPVRGDNGVVTILGTANLPANRLFVSGDQDGPVGQALLQHPLGVAYRQGKLYIADTYNNKIKELDLSQLTIRSLAGVGEAGRGGDQLALDEPGGLSIAGDQLFIADTNNHAIRVLDLKGEGKLKKLEIKGLKPPLKANAMAGGSVASAPRGTQLTWEPKVVQSAGEHWVAQITLQLPPGFKLNPGSPVRYQIRPVGATAAEVGAAPTWQTVPQPSTQFELSIPMRGTVPLQRAAISVSFLYCRTGDEGVCKQADVTWTGAVTVGAAGLPALELRHAPPP